MIEFFKNKITGKRLLILGFGREGESTYKFLRKHFPTMYLTIADYNEQSIKKCNDDYLSFITGSGYLHNISDYDLIFKSPGISLKDISISREKITSQTDLFLEYYSKQIIGITGTKGKSTTSSLIYYCIKLFTQDAVLVGNIGVPPFDMIDDIKKNTRIVFELSAHQLEYISKGPHTAILLNLFQEHLDYFNTFENYQSSKFNITKLQDSTDNFIYNADDDLIHEHLSKNKLTRNYYPYSYKTPVNKGCWIEDNKLYFFDDALPPMIIDLSGERYLAGDHNLLNIMAAACACRITGIPYKKIKEGITAFKGLEHRIEYVGEYNGIIYYNDSIATIPEATIEAIKTLKKVSTLILGGFDRGIDYSHLIEFLVSSKIKNLVFLGNAGKRMLDGIKNFDVKNIDIEFAETFVAAVNIAKAKTKPSEICLLSPAAASYDMFKNFEERGHVYKKIVREL